MQNEMRSNIAITILLLISICFCVSAESTRTPLLMKGKKSLYQRVLTRPGAVLRKQPSANSLAVVSQVPALSVFFVYGKRKVEAKEWLEVGVTDKESEGWLPRSKAVDWKHNITLGFTLHGERQPVLFFRNRKQLLTLLESGMMLSEVRRYRKKIKNHRIPDAFPVIAVEPETTVSLDKNFYLLPILDFDFTEFQGFPDTRILQVASITLEEGAEDLLEKGGIAPSAIDQVERLSNFRAGIVFVIDSTRSMGPYIDRTRDTVRRIYKKLRQSRLGGKISFGLIAFRDSVAERPDLDLEYVTRVFAKLSDGLNEERFFRKVDQVVPAHVSSKGFNEDVYAGIEVALKEIDWSRYDGKYIIVITDAGARRSDDPYSSTGLNAKSLRRLARRKEGAPIAISVLHLLTPDGQFTHRVAAKQYRALSYWDQDVGSLYFGVEEGEVSEYGKIVGELTDAIIQNLENTRDGKITKVPPARTSSSLARKTALISRAQQLAYLGRVGDTKVPKLYTAWVAERDFDNPRRKPLEVRVLITKNQLSNLQEMLEIIFETSEQFGLIESQDFFNNLKAVAATMARKPESFVPQRLKTLADVSRAELAEWLEDLPYKSEILRITEDVWLEWGPSQQREFLNNIEAKIQEYRRIHNNTDLWVRLAEKGDAITTIPVDSLP
jgi:serine/threonine-protein kinase PpkA